MIQNGSLKKHRTWRLRDKAKRAAEKKSLPGSTSMSESDGNKSGSPSSGDVPKRPSLLRLYLTLRKLKKMNIPEVVKSKKAWAAVAGAAILAFSEQLGIPTDIAQWIAAIVGAYILGQAHVDAAKIKSQ